MNTDALKLKFINLRLSSMKLSEIIKILGISESTAHRWNKKFSETIRNTKSQQDFIANKKIVNKIDEYLNLFENHFQVIENELNYYKKFPMSFDVALDNSLKLFKTIQQLISMKKSLSAVLPNDELSDAFLADSDDENSDTKICDKDSKSINIVETPAEQRRRLQEEIREKKDNKSDDRKTDSPKNDDKVDKTNT